MDHKKIIAEAWTFTQSNKKMIIGYAFVPAVFTTLTGIVYAVYQYYAFKSSVLFENWDRTFGYYLATTGWDVVKNNLSFLGPVLVAAIIIAILYFLLPPFCEGAIIQLIARKKNGLPVRTRDGFRLGPQSFLPLFEYSWVIRSFNIVSAFTMFSTIARNFGASAISTMIPVIIIYVIVGIILTLLLTYTEFFIVIDDYKVFKSIAKSCGLVVTHLGETIMLSILMLIISVRILVQLLFVLLIPIIISGSIYLFTAATMPMAGIIVGSILGLVLLYIACYLSGTIQVFASTVWTFTFLELTGKPNINARGEEVKDNDNEDIDTIKDDLKWLKKAR
jgi:hypothetical protein